ncbi:GntR family transcriptional regulator [Pseudaminobacter soli (ex Zhang et al. 2022)]|uniref:GntR family transcriptional regulator n=1 Tax=Pseudaminobacter soli (ex Zhang et al. 2022) TaxID=2831468 RepID=UPI00307FEB54
MRSRSAGANKAAAVGSARRISRGTLHEEVAIRLRDMILVDELSPGQIIPEMQLCEEFGISRTPMREALKVLASENLVELLPGRGAVVVQPSADDVMGMLYAIGAIEGVAGQLACQFISPREFAEIQQLHDRMLAYHAAGDRLKYFDMNQRIHKKIVAASKNVFLIDLHDKLNMRSRRMRYVSNSQRQWWDQAIREHEQILAALERRDAEALSEQLRAHMMGSWKDVKGVLASDEANP